MTEKDITKWRDVINAPDLSNANACPSRESVPSATIPIQILFSGI